MLHAKAASAILLRTCAGRGKHSVDGRPRLKLAVARALSETGYRFAPDPTNDGIIEVRFGGRNF